MGERLVTKILVVFLHAPIDIVRGTDVEPTLRILEDVDPETIAFCGQTRQVGLEPTTSRLTAGCSTIELLPNCGHSTVNPDGSGLYH